MNFVLKLYQRQILEGRVFLHEHPANAKSWMLQEVQRLSKEEGVLVVEAGQCMYGLTTRGQNTPQRIAAKKPTNLMTNSRALGRELNRKCDKKNMSTGV